MMSLHKLECLPHVQKVPRTNIDVFSNCSPAGGIRAAFDFTERRHVPLAALRLSYANCRGAYRRAMLHISLRIDSPRCSEQSLPE